MRTVQINDEQQVSVTVRPFSEGNIGRSAENIQWGSSDPSIATVTPLPYTAGDTEFSAIIVSAGVGICQVSFSADVDVTEGTQTLSDTIEVTVLAAQATHFDIELGTPERKPPPPSPELLPSFQSGLWSVQGLGYLFPGETKGPWKIDDSEYERGAMNLDSSVLRNWIGVYLDTPAEAGTAYALEVEVGYVNQPTTDQTLTAAFSNPPSQTQGTLLSGSADVGVYTATIIPTFNASVFFLEVGTNSGFGECFITRASLKKV